MNRRWLWVMGIIALTGLVSGCVGVLVSGAATGVSLAHDRRSAGTIVDDQSIEIKLYDAFVNQLPPGSRVSTTSYNSTVLLTGDVPTPQARQQAVHLAQHLNPPRVRLVHDELVIAPPLALSAQSNDAFLTTKVKAALLQIHDIPDFDPTRVKVVTERSIVYLLGLVTQREADAAAQVASQVNGVRQVITLFEFIPAT